jgi:uncharacterized membrane protein (UPF0127 family)
MRANLKRLSLLLALLPAGAAIGAGCRVTVVGTAGETTFEVEVAKTRAAWTQGLMGRVELPNGHGMLFDFGRERQVSMWMKDTLIPLDMLFFHADGRLALREAHAKPGSLTLRGPPVAVRYVLELNAGEGPLPPLLLRPAALARDCPAMAPAAAR